MNTKTTIDLPTLTDTIARRVASGQRALYNRRDLAFVLRTAKRAGYSLDAAQRAVEDTSALAALYRNEAR